jgi:hypothetical protein
MSLDVWSEGRRIGQIELSNGVLTGKPWSVQEMCQVMLRKAGGDAGAAYRMLSGYNNGYLEVAPENAPRRERGSVGTGPGTGTIGSQVLGLAHFQPRTGEPGAGAGGV